MDYEESRMVKVVAWLVVLWVIGITLGGITYALMLVVK